MKLPIETIISSEKLKLYLLAPKKRNNKSRWLAKAGYLNKNWQTLEKDLRAQILTLPATPTEKTNYGQMYEIRGKLIGPDGTSLDVCTIWMHEFETNITKFITMFPDKIGRKKKMKYELFKEMVLLIDIPEKGLRKGDIATIVDHHPSKRSHDGYSLEVFNALGDTIDVITVSEIEIEPLKENEILSVRSLEAA